VQTSSFFSDIFISLTRLSKESKISSVGVTLSLS